MSREIRWREKTQTSGLSGLLRLTGNREAAESPRPKENLQENQPQISQIRQISMEYLISVICSDLWLIIFESVFLRLGASAHRRLSGGYPEPAFAASSGSRFPAS